MADQGLQGDAAPHASTSGDASGTGPQSHHRIPSVIDTPNKTVLEAKRKFGLHMEDHLLDYKHTHPVHIDNCASTLIRIFGNVLDNPTEQKFRQVNAASNVFKTNIANVKAGEELMQLAGWRQQVVQLQKYWVFDADVGSIRFNILKEAKHVLEHAIRTIHEKAEKAKQEKQSKQAAEKALREKVLLALEDDKLDRKLRQMTQPITGPVASLPLPSEQRPRSTSGAGGHDTGRGGGHAQQVQEEEDEEEEKKDKDKEV